MDASAGFFGLGNIVNRLKRVLGRVVSDSRWRSFYLQRYVRIPWVRKFVSRQIARRLPPAPVVRAGTEMQQRITRLREQGVAVFHDTAPRGEIENLRAYLRKMECVDPDQPGAPGFRWPSGAAAGCVHAYYPLDTLLAAPEVLRLANSPRILELVENAFGCVPTISEINCWWLRHDFDLEAAKVHRDYYVEHQKNYHRDIDDWSVLRYFVYLTDVDEQHGPHSYIPGTHNRSLGHRREIDFDEAYRELYDQRIDITGPAGTGILIDPFGLHRATVPIAGDRLMLAVSYSLGTTNNGAPKLPPLESTDVEIDSFVNRLFVGRTACAPPRERQTR